MLVSPENKRKLEEKLSYLKSSFTKDCKIFTSKSLSTLPPYKELAIVALIASQGIFSGGILALPSDTLSIHWSIEFKEHLWSASPN